MSKTQYQIPVLGLREVAEALFVGMCMTALLLVISPKVHAAQDVTLVADTTIMGDVGTATFNADAILTIESTVSDGLPSIDNIDGSNIAGSSIYFDTNGSLVNGLPTATEMQRLWLNESGADGSRFNLGGVINAQDVFVGNGIAGSTLLNSTSDITFTGDLVFQNGDAIWDLGEYRHVVTDRFESNASHLSFTLSTVDGLSADSYNVNNFDFFDGVGSGKLTTGVMTINGGETFDLRYTSSLKDGVSYTLIDNQGLLTGSYSQTEDSGRIIDNSYVLDSRVVSAANDLVLSVSRNDDSYITKSATVGHHSNPAALALGTIARQGFQVGDLSTAINLLDLDENGFGNNQTNLAREVKRLAPIANNSLWMSSFDSLDLMRGQVDKRLTGRRGILFDPKERVDAQAWGQFVTQLGEQNGEDTYNGYRTTALGGVTGIDKAFGFFRVGAAAGYTLNNIEQSDDRSGEETDDNQLLLTTYGSWMRKHLFVNSSVSYGFGNYDGTRKTAVGREADYDFDYSVIDGRIGIGYRFDLEDAESAFTPYVQYNVSHLDQDSYTESGAGDLSLAVEGETITRQRAEVGAIYSHRGHVRSMRSVLQLRAAAGVDDGLDGHDVHASYTGDTAENLLSFTTLTKDPGEQFIKLGGDITLAKNKQLNLSFSYQLEHRRARQTHAGLFSLQYLFN